MPAPHDPALTAIYARAAYRVRLPRGGHACIRCGAPLPVALRRLLPATDAPWAFVTACNPHSRRLPSAVNRQRQRRLLRWLRDAHPHADIRAGVGTGAAWRESSLFVVGITPPACEELMRRFQQNAVILGHGDSNARLAWNPIVTPTPPEMPT